MDQLLYFLQTKEKKKTLNCIKMKRKNENIKKLHKTIYSLNINNYPIQFCAMNKVNKII